jgi:hypothetical protein
MAINLPRISLFFSLSSSPIQQKDPSSGQMRIRAASTRKILESPRAKLCGANEQQKKRNYCASSKIANN